MLSPTKPLETANSVEAAQDGRIISRKSTSHSQELKGWNRGAGSRHPTALALAARERRLREVHTGRR